MRRAFLYTVAFATGAAVMASELSASRLVAPFFGTSTPVWALLIGTVLSAMAVGQLVGGRLAGRAAPGGPGPVRLLSALLLLAALLLALLPVVGRPVMGGAMDLMRGGSISTLAASALGVNAVLALPMAALGAAGPVLLHQAVESREETGRIAGRIYALGTAGSLLGTWLSGLLLIPLLGTRTTLWLCAAGLALLGVIGLLRGRGRGVGAAAVLLLLAGGLALPQGPIKARPGAIYEAETVGNYVQVVEDGLMRALYLNDGYAIQSLYPLDGSLPLFDVWGYYGAGPAWTEGGVPARVLLLGLGGGTSARILRELYPRAEIVGVELDPEVVEAGRRFLGMPADIQVEVEDARAWLVRDDSRYDLIVVDAFQFPYVPFQLCTQEFFQSLEDHLEPGGTAMLNVGRDADSYEVVDALAATLAEVFPVVRGADVRNGSNTILLGSQHGAEADAGLRALGLEPRALARLLRLDTPTPWEIDPAAPLLSDDRAPVELLTDMIVLRASLRIFGLDRGQG
jgi:MFS family permease